MNRVALVYPRANIDTVPSLVGAAELLAEHGFGVDIYCYSAAGEPTPRFTHPRISLRSLGVDGLVDHSTAGLRSAVRGVRWLPTAARAPLRRSYAALGA